MSLFIIYYIIGVLVLWGLAVVAKKNHPDWTFREYGEISYSKILLQAFVWPLVIIGYLI